MSRPAVEGIIDLMISFPSARPEAKYHFMQPLLKDEDSRGRSMPAGFLFKDVPEGGPGAEDAPEEFDPVAALLAEMDKYGIAVGLIGIGPKAATRALADHPDRFVPSLEVDPNDIGGAVRKIREAREEHGIKAVSTFPAGCNPQVPVSDRRYYPVYQTCVDLDIPIIVNAGIAGPRVPSACQHVMHFDEVCYDFPDLAIVMRHGAEPWEDLAVKLMLKWPGLYYMTSAFAPKYYPKPVIDYANTRGSDKVMYAGYYPMGLSLERIFRELEDLPLREHVWPMFLRDNAARVFKIEVPTG
jgi:predicted TIM-barrel fold metal-dependent hydrolase